MKEPIVHARPAIARDSRLDKSHPRHNGAASGREVSLSNDYTVMTTNGLLDAPEEKK